MLAFLGADAPALEYFSERLVLAHLWVVKVVARPTCAAPTVLFLTSGFTYKFVGWVLGRAPLISCINTADGTSNAFSRCLLVIVRIKIVLMLLDWSFLQIASHCIERMNYLARLHLLGIVKALFILRFLSSKCDLLWLSNFWYKHRRFFIRA
jgi:hypothetical protein